MGWRCAWQRGAGKVSRTVRTDWQDTAKCRLDADWTAESAGQKRPTDAVMARLKAVCRECPVQSACAEYAITNRLEACVIAGLWVPPRAVSSGKGLGAGYTHVLGLLANKADAA